MCRISHLYLANRERLLWVNTRRSKTTMRAAGFEGKAAAQMAGTME
jgi:hypothetical protein